MATESFVTEQIKKQGILPLFYHDDQDVCVAVTQALYAAGIRVIEFTNRGEAALANFKELVSIRDKKMKDLLLAVGTVKTGEQAGLFIAAGADLLISPIFDSGVADLAYIHKMVWIPGCMTPTEVHVAEKAGITLVKLFPGNTLTPGFVGAIRELFPAMSFMPTGGVEITKESIGAWFASGVCAVGLGSKLISKDVLAKKDYRTIQEQTQKVLAIVKEVRSV